MNIRKIYHMHGLNTNKTFPRHSTAESSKKSAAFFEDPEISILLKGRIKILRTIVESPV
jgi:hypothetical protein